MGSFGSVEIKSDETGPMAPVVTTEAPQTPVVETKQAAQVDPGDDPVDLPSAGERVERPKWLPTKFATAEAMAEAYRELERKQSSPASVTPAKPDAAGEALKVGDKGKTETPAAGQVSEAEMLTYEQEFAANGSLSEGTYAGLTARGIPKHMVDAYIAGQQAIGQRHADAVLNQVGGREQYTAMVEWAKGNLSVEERSAYDAAVTSRDITRATLAVKGLAAQYAQATSRPQLLKGKTSAESAAAKFNSTAEVSAAMSDARYSTDPAYREAVYAKLRNSSIL